MKIRELKCYVEGGYVSSKPDYGPIYRIDNNKPVYICDYGVPLKENAERCAEANNWIFKRMYKDRRYEGMVLVFISKGVRLGE